MSQVVELYHWVLNKIHKATHWACHEAETCGHCTYLAFVSYEAHGNYKYAAAILLVIIISKEAHAHITKVKDNQNETDNNV